MSVLIPEMDVPERCAECRFLDGTTMDGLCRAARKWFDDDEYWYWYYFEEDDIDDSKPLNCPLVEIPPHGRLIDADALFREISKRTNAAYEWRQKATDEDIQARAEATYMAFVEVALTISNLPTIIEAEE